MKRNVYNKLKLSIKKYWNSIDLEQRYKKYNMPIASCPVTKQFKESINKCNGNYAKNLLLKKTLCLEMENGVEKKELNFWIIREWGGIKAFIASDENQKRIENFYTILETERTASIQRLASFSKVASFASPLSYFVYDSRVTYSINWLLRKAGATDGFFPFLPGRNKLTNHCNLKAVLDAENRAFRNAHEAYFDYCQLISTLYYDIYPNGNEPYKLEMLLFQMAPIEIFDEFKSEFNGTDFYCDSLSSAGNSNKDLNSVTAFQKHSINGRYAEYGSILFIDGCKLFVFVGRDKQKIYCELLYKGKVNKNYPFQIEFLEEGFIMRGKSHPYLIKVFKRNQGKAARNLYDKVLNKLRDIIKVL